MVRLRIELDEVAALTGRMVEPGTGIVAGELNRHRIAAIPADVADAKHVALGDSVRIESVSEPSDRAGRFSQLLDQGCR